MSVNFISIPIGTIKRRDLLVEVQLQDKFQFLLVQLKEEKTVLQKFRLFLFQFLLVQLKVSFSIELLQHHSYFNSYWYN